MFIVHESEVDFPLCIGCLCVRLAEMKNTVSQRMIASLVSSACVQWFTFVQRYLQLEPTERYVKKTPSE